MSNVFVITCGHKNTDKIQKSCIQNQVSIQLWHNNLHVSFSWIFHIFCSLSLIVLHQEELDKFLWAMNSS